ncbi:MAG: carboxypeptidase regulatory-like domain-containing protein, partial [Gemmatimonadetes bacterium]|nr:carboxypeptidase regulatory-like domain-containing protein [Gemmatimonadota bacterium]
MRSVRLSSLLAIFALLLAPLTAAHAASSLDGTRGLLRVHSADMHTPGYIAGTVHGLYSRSTYNSIESPRGFPETVKFGAGTLSFAYAPTPYAELALRGTLESQFVDSEPATFSDKQYGISGVGFNLKALITPADQNQWMLGGELGLASSAGSLDALTGSWDYDGMDISGRLNLTYQQLRAEDQKAALRMHMNAGYLARTSQYDATAAAFTSIGGTPDRSRLHGDQFLYGMGLELPVPQGWTLFTEWSGEYDTESNADFMDNPMRVTPGLRWSNPASSFTFTGGVELSMANENAGPGWQVITGLAFGGYVAPVKGLLRGIIRDADTGQPLNGVRVSVRNSADIPAESDPDGRFQSELPEGYAVLELAAEGYNPKTRVVEIKGHESQDFDFTLAKRNVLGSVRGRIRDAETGEPLFARVRVAGTENWIESDPSTGSFALENVQEGDRRLEVDARSYEGRTVMARVVAG